MSEPSSKLEQQVSDCLTHLYNINLLKDQTLVQQLIPAAQGSDRPHLFRLEMMRLIESLKPLGDVDFYSKPARIYNILQLRYIEGQTHAEVAEQLGLSESQYYREHRRALEAITAAVDERLRADDQPPDITFTSEWQRARSQGHNASATLTSILDGAREITQELARTRTVSLTLDISPAANETNLSGAGLRQIAILLLSQLLIHAQPGGQLAVTGDASGGMVTMVFHLQRLVGRAMRLTEYLANYQTLNQLVQSLNATLSCVPDGPDGFVVTLMLPVNERKILVIDDNPDATSLLRRFLSQRNYACIEAHSSAAGIQLAQELRPWLVILDVMMPDTDGWKVLQSLKNHPDTRHIPVLICSVLDIPEVALSLGADGYLKKPPQLHELMTLLARWES